MKRREFIAGLGSATAAWPVVARAQQAEHLRRIGVLMPVSSDDREYQARFAAFLEGLQQLGWVGRRNVQMDIRWGAGDADLLHKYAEERALGPDVLMAFTSNAVPPLQQATHAIPIVFAIVADPVGAGYVESLARPGGNVTGFITYEYALAGKWLELLKEIAPRTARVAVLRDTAVAGGPAEFGAIQAVAASLGVELQSGRCAQCRRDRARYPGVCGEPKRWWADNNCPAATVNRKLIIMLAAQHKLPAIYNSRYYAADGGLISYGPDYVDECWRAAGYVDRILKGEKPADLPVQAPTKYELVINLKTAKALMLTVSPSLLTRADEVIE